MVGAPTIAGWLRALPRGGARPGRGGLARPVPARCCLRPLARAESREIVPEEIDPRSPAAPARRPRFAAARLPVLALLAVATGAWLLYAEPLAAPAPLMDEAIYLGAAARVSAWGDPYDEEGYLYAPPFAHLLAGIQEADEPRALATLRWAALAGLWALVWVSLAGSAWPWPAQAAAALAIVAAPITANGIGCGNASVVFVGPALAAVALAPRWPLGGLLAGTVNALKPLGVGALFVAVTPGRRRPAGWAVGFTAATLAAAAAWLTLGSAELPSMLRNSGGLPDFKFNLSVHRALASLGVRVHPGVPFALATGAGMALAWWRVRGGRERVAVAGTAALLGLPLVNASTFLFSVPAQVLAAERVFAAAGSAWRAGRRRRAVAEVALVAAAMASIEGALGGVSADTLPFPAEGLVVLIPLAAAAALTVYALAPAPAGR